MSKNRETVPATKITSVAVVRHLPFIANEQSDLQALALFLMSYSQID